MAIPEAMVNMSRKRGAAASSYSYDDDEDYVPTKHVKYSEREDILPVKVKKHTLDSDEEEEDGGGPGTCAGDDDDDDEGGGKQYDILRDEDIDGQEDRTVDFEGETKITPFNMKEELEEGHFDGDGFYHFKKDGDIKDAWLEDIDWIKVKHVEDNVDKYGSDYESDEDETGKVKLPHTSENKLNPIIEVYKQILEMLKPSENVTRALKRLGGNNKRISSAQKWKMKKLGQSEDDKTEQMAAFLELTELANKIIETGNMDVYQETYEMINLKIQHATAPPPPPKPSMDMFADEGQSTSNGTSNGTESKEDKSAFDSVAEIKWQFRWDNNDDAEIHGPFTTDKMLKWQQSEFFKKGVYVRKTCEIGGSWYSSKRIDFELYL